MTGTCQDVTDRRNAEEQLRLAHRMESVGRLAGGVAHEANNQMSVVIGAAEFHPAPGRPPAAVRADAEYIRPRRRADRGGHRPTAGVQPAAGAQAPGAGSQRLLERFRPVLQRTMGEDCTVTLLLDPGLAVAVRADPGQLEQVLLNLALNARDAMPRGGALTVETVDGRAAPRRPRRCRTA